MHKAVIINSDFENKAPSAKEIQTYLNKTGKLLYGNDKRKSANTPYTDTIHLVMSSFSEFEEALTGKVKGYGTTQTLYVFDDKVNETHFFLKYVEQIQCHFKLDASIIDSMWKAKWNSGHLKNLKKSLEKNADFGDFMIKKNIGSAKLHKSLPKFAKATNDYIAKIDSEITAIEENAVSLFTSGW